MKKFKDIHAVVFDLGDTLISHSIDLEDRMKRIFKDTGILLASKGYSVSETFLRKLDAEMWKAWKTRYHLLGREFRFEFFLEHWLSELGVKQEHVSRLAVSIAGITYKHDLDSLVLKPSAKATLDMLYRASYSLALITNTSYSYEHIQTILRQFEIKEYFKVILTSSEEGISKPNPKFFIKALDLLAVEAKNSVLIGDDPRLDIEAARNVGMRAILVVKSRTKMPELSDSEIPVVEELLEVLDYLG